MSPVDTSQRFSHDLKGLLAFETLISDLSSRFINLPPAEVDREIEDALRRVCELLGIDFACLWQWSDPAAHGLVPTHTYPSQGAPRTGEPVRQEDYPWSVQEVIAGRVISLSTLDDAPPEAAVDVDTCRRLGIKSCLCLPLTAGDEPPVGALGFNTLHAERDWPDPLVKRLRLVAQVITNTLVRKRHEVSLRASDERLSAGAELAGLAFYEVDFRERTAFIDERFGDVCGIPPDSRQGLKAVKSWIEHVHPDDRRRVLEQRQELHDGTLERLSIEYRYLHPAHGERWLHHLGRVTRRDARGQTIRTFGVLRDITERRQREEALRGSYAEIKRLKDRLQAESDYLKAEIRVVDPHVEFTGQSPVIRSVLRQVEQVAPTDSSVLVRGETGSGKELVAQAIHRLGPRRSHLLVKVNCAALPSGLVESELFGREKGAYTGALTRQVGRFEVADGSTLFLDEVGELSLEVQAKLLRVLETGEFERLGSPKSIKVDVRLIAATNRDLLAEIQKGRFREDLYYRLNVFPIRVPPLRERPEDIPALVWVFLEGFCTRMGKRITQVPRKTMEALQRQPWPGNVRELRNVIEHAAIVTTGDTLRVPALDDTATAVAAPPPTLADSERELIRRALESTGGRVKGPKGAAAALGLNPSTLFSRMKKLGIGPSGRAEDA
jgi:formate hydrogenlyase transcriptional activator